MAKATVEWTEDDVLSLPQGENDTFERKGALLLDLTLPNVKEDEVRGELSKQLSAFANSGGGQVIYGLTDAGTVDKGGVARSVKGRQSTKEWLENLIPTLTDFEIAGFNVYEICPKAAGSSLAADRSIYVVDVPDSDRAPHQSKHDHKYYVRLGGNSLPASHRLIEDIRNRARHPTLEVHDLQIVGASAGGAVATVKSTVQVNISIKFGLRNIGRVRATTGCLQVSAAIPITTGRFDTPDFFTRSGVPGTVLFELKNPLYHGMDIALQCHFNILLDIEILAKGELLTVGGVTLEDALFSITAFADSAPPQKQDFRLGLIDPDRTVVRSLEQGINRYRFSGDRRWNPIPGGSPWQ
jgi:hypothetical protein